MSIDNITNDEYQSWCDNDVTKRFLAEIAGELDETTREQLFGTHEEIIAQSHARNEAMDILGKILEWKPVELEEIDD